MPFTYSIDLSQNLIRQTVWGDISASDLREITEATRSDPLYRDKLDVLADLREARIHIPFSEMVDFTQFLSARADIGRQAVVVSRALEFGQVRMYEQLTDNSLKRAELRLFSTVEDAERWLGVIPVVPAVASAT